MVYKKCSTAFWLLPDAFAAGENFWKIDLSVLGAYHPPYLCTRKRDNDRWITDKGKSSRTGKAGKEKALPYLGC